MLPKFLNYRCFRKIPAAAAAFIASVSLLLSVVGAATHTVTNDAPSGGGSLFTTIANAGSGDRIVFAANLDGATINWPQPLVTGQAIEIDAGDLPNGVNVVGRDVFGLLRFLTTGPVTITGVNFSLGRRADGGAIASNAQLTLTRCNFTDNTASAPGGAVFSNGPLVIDRCHFASNTSNADGGAVHARQSVEITGSTFSDNRGIFGGAISKVGSGSVVINSSTFTGNTAARDGGGIFGDGVSSISIAHTTVTDNTAQTRSGGGVYRTSGTLTLENSIVAGNTAPSGANLNTSATDQFGNNILTGDPRLRALGNYGGPVPTRPPALGSPAIDGGTGTSGGDTDQRGLPRIADGNADGTAVIDIGAVELQPGEIETDLTVQNLNSNGPGSLFDTLANLTPLATTIRFSPTLDGGSIAFLTTAVLTGKNVDIDASNLPAGIDITVGGNSRLFDLRDAASLTLRNLTLRDGTSTRTGNDGGGAIKVSGASSLTAGNCTFHGHFSNALGGAVYATGSGTSIRFENCTFAQNEATTRGGALMVSDGANLSLVHSTVTANTASNGGGISNDNANVSIENAVVARNSASAGAPDVEGFINTHPGIMLIGSLDGTLVATTTGTDILTGDPKLAPFGNYNGPHRTAPPLLDSPLRDSATASLPIGVRGVPRPQGPASDIGAVEAIGPTVLVTSNADRLTPENTFDHSDLTLRDAITWAIPGDTITFAPGLDGATIALAGESIVIDRPLRIDGRGLRRAPAIDAVAASRVFEIQPGITATLSEVTIRNGDAEFASFDQGRGGGVHNRGFVKISKCTLTANRASRGGGVFNDGAAARCDITDSTVSGNSATTGGGIASTGGDIGLRNATVSANSASEDGSGVALTDTTLVIVNSIISANESDGATDIFTQEGRVSAGGRNLIGPHRSEPPVAPFIDPFLRIAFSRAAPHLAPLGWYGGPTQTMPPLLEPLSPAINRPGAFDFGGTDQRGIPRPQAGTPDIGAVEALTFPFFVTETSDAPGTPTFNRLSLREAVAFALPGQRIDFAPALDGQVITLSQSPIEISRPVVIDAARLDRPATVQGDRTAGIFTVSQGGSLSVSSLHLTGGHALAGGAISVVGGTLAASDLEISGCTATHGGAIHNDAGSVTLNRCFVHHNHADENGGAIANNSSAETSILRSRLSRNSAGRDGGAIASPDTASTTLVASTIDHNAARTNGGAIASHGDLDILNSTLAHNRAGSRGGAVYQAPVGGTDLELASSTLALNSASIGGGLFFTNPKSDLPGLALIQNSAIAKNLPQDVISPSNENRVTPFGENFIGNNSGVADIFPAGPLAGTFAEPLDPRLGHLATYGGTARCMPPLADSPLIDAGSVFAPVPTPESDQRGFGRVVDSDGVPASDSGYELDIGAVESGPAIIVDSVRDELNPAGPTSLREAIAQSPASGRILFSTAIFNGDSRDAIILDPNLGELQVFDTSLMIDASNLAGGARVMVAATQDADHRILHVANAQLALHSLTLSNGFASGELYPSNSGGGIFASGSDLALERVTTRFNRAFDQGGGIHIDAGSASAFQSGIDRNTTSNKGGGISMLSATLALDSSTVSNNAASVFAGGILNTAGRLELANSTVAQNQSGETGGGIIINGTHASAQLSFTTVAMNAAPQFGGGICNTGTLELSNSIVARNTARFGPDIDGALSAAKGINLVGIGDGVAGGLPAQAMTGFAAFSQLGYHGGPTETLILLKGSAGTGAATRLAWNPLYDQRGEPRFESGFSNLGAYETGTADNYADWISEALPAGFDTTFDGDADGDGTSNGAEFAFCTAPFIPDSSSTRLPSIDQSAVGGVQISFSLNDAALSSISWRVFRSRDLGQFTEIFRFENFDNLTLDPNVDWHLDDNTTPMTLIITDRSPGSGSSFYTVRPELAP